MNPGVTDEVGQTTRSFFEALKDQPLSLALVVMNFALVAFLFYSNAQTLEQRKQALDQIVAWQKGTDSLMANCVSKDVMELVVNALERDRALVRSLLPLSPLVVPAPGGKPLVLPQEHLPPLHLPRREELKPEPKLQNDEPKSFRPIPQKLPLPILDKIGVVETFGE